MNQIVPAGEDVFENDFQIKVATRPQAPWPRPGRRDTIDSATQGLGVYLQKLHVLSEMNKTIACTIEGRARPGYAPRVALREGMKRSIAWVLERGPCRAVGEASAQNRAGTGGSARARRATRSPGATHC